MNTETTRESNRQAARNALAAVGFIALIFIGMTLAVLTARYIPAAVSSIGQAAVSLSSVFTPAKSTGLQVVGTGTEIPFGTPAATSTASVIATTTTVTQQTTTTAPATTPVATAPVTPVAGTPSETAYVVPGASGTAIAPAPATLYGLPDLSISNMVVGYLPNENSPDSAFIPSATVPNGARFAVKFTVANTGTNSTGVWDFSAMLPTTSTYTFYSPVQQSLNPGDHIDFMLHLDVGEAEVGTSDNVTITLDPNRDVTESNEGNNVGSATVTVQ